MIKHEKKTEQKFHKPAMQIIIATFAFKEVRARSHRVVSRVNIENANLPQRTNKT